MWVLQGEDETGTKEIQPDTKSIFEANACCKLQYQRFVFIPHAQSFNLYIM